MTSPISLTTTNKFGTTSIRQRILDGSRRLSGVSITHAAVAPLYPITVAKELSRWGYNWVNLHNFEYQLHTGEVTIETMRTFMDALYQAGIRVSLTLCSELGMTVNQNIYEFRTQLYDGQDSALSLYYKHIERMIPLLTHPACFLVDLVNEGAFYTTPDKAFRHWNKFLPEIRSIDPDLLISDCADAWTKGIIEDPMTPEWLKLSKLYDVFIPHFYVDDGDGDGRANWAAESWQGGNLVHFFTEIGKPCLIQEFGSYRLNPHQGSNIAWLLALSHHYGMSYCHFDWASGPAGYQPGGDPTSVYSMTNDLFRQGLGLLGNLMLKQAPFTYTFWEGPEFIYMNGGLTITNQYASVPSGTDRRYLFRFDRSQPLFWITRSL